MSSRYNDFVITFAGGGSQERVAIITGAWEQTHQKGLTGAALLDAIQSQSR